MKKKINVCRFQRINTSLQIKKKVAIMEDTTFKL